MKKLLYFTILISLLFSCNNGTNKIVSEKTTVKKSSSQVKEKDIKKLKDFAISYSPTKIDFSDNPELNKFDINYIFNSPQFANNLELKDKISNILLLKIYLHHLQNHNQGYDLLSMRRGEAKYIIDYFALKNGIEIDKNEFLNSAIPYDMLAVCKHSDSLCDEINQLSIEIERQKNRILEKR